MLLQRDGRGMASSIDQLMGQIATLQAELEAELAIRRANLNYTLRSGRIRFEQEVLRAHKAMRVNLTRYVLNAGVMHVVTAPVYFSASVSMWASAPSVVISTTGPRICR